MTRTVKQLHYLTSMVNAVKKKNTTRNEIKTIAEIQFFFHPLSPKTIIQVFQHIICTPKGCH